MDNNITPTTFVAYEWNDLLRALPDDFADLAYEVLGASSKVTFGDAEHTLIKGTLAMRILFDAWDEWDGAEEHDRNEVFARLPSLINALVALNG